MKEKSKKNRFVLVGLIVLVVMVFAGGYWYTQFKVPHDKAVSKFNSAQQTVQLENEKLEKEKLEANKLKPKKKIYRLMSRRWQTGA